MFHYAIALVFGLLGVGSLLRFAEKLATGGGSDFLQLIIGLVCLGFAARRVKLARAVRADEPPEDAP